MAFYKGMLMLLACSATTMVATASPHPTGNVTIIHGPDELNSQVAHQFLTCLENTGKDYNIYVDEAGITVVIPVESRVIDSASDDAALFQCIKVVNHRMDIAVESTIYEQDEHKTATSSKTVSHEWLSGQGALGKRELGTRSGKPTFARRSETAGIDKRDNIYWSHLDIDKKCDSVDSNPQYPGGCVTYMSAYASVMFENPTGSDLNMEIWPHHDCDKGNSRTFVVNAGTTNRCTDRTTYSFRGTF